MLLQFRMLSDEDDNFLRDYLLPPEMTLADLHAFISDDLKYEKENMTSFFTSDREWNRLSEYTYLDLGLGEDEGWKEPPFPAQERHDTGRRDPAKPQPVNLSIRCSGGSGLLSGTGRRPAG